VDFTRWAVGRYAPKTIAVQDLEVKVGRNE